MTSVVSNASGGIVRNPQKLSARELASRLVSEISHTTPVDNKTDFFIKNQQNLSNPNNHNGSAVNNTVSQSSNLLLNNNNNKPKKKTSSGSNNSYSREGRPSTDQFESSSYNNFNFNKATTPKEANSNETSFPGSDDLGEEEPPIRTDPPSEEEILEKLSEIISQSPRIPTGRLKILLARQFACSMALLQQGLGCTVPEARAKVDGGAKDKEIAEMKAKAASNKTSNNILN